MVLQPVRQLHLIISRRFSGAEACAVCSGKTKPHHTAATATQSEEVHQQIPSIIWLEGSPAYYDILLLLVLVVWSSIIWLEGSPAYYNILLLLVCWWHGMWMNVSCTWCDLLPEPLMSDGVQGVSRCSVAYDHQWSLSCTRHIVRRSWMYMQHLCLLMERVICCSLGISWDKLPFQPHGGEILYRT